MLFLSFPCCRFLDPSGLHIWGITGVMRSFGLCRFESSKKSSSPPLFFFLIEPFNYFVGSKVLIIPYDVYFIINGVVSTFWSIGGSILCVYRSHLAFILCSLFNSWSLFGYSFLDNGWITSFLWRTVFRKLLRSSLMSGELLKLLDISSPESVLPTTYGSLQPPLGKHRLKVPISYRLPEWSTWLFIWLLEFFGW